jgi:hypothetical protein
MRAARRDLPLLDRTYCFDIPATPPLLLPIRRAQFSDHSETFHIPE